MKPVLKICNIKNIYEARSAGELGIPFIGIHLVSDTDHKNIDLLKRIIVMIHEEFHETKTILVTKEKNIQTLSELIDKLECDGVQLHFKIQEKLITLLKSRYGKRFIVFSVLTEEDSFVSQAVIKRADYIILDKNYTGGTGKYISAESRNKIIQQLPHDKLLLAGGIDAKFIRQKALTLPVAGFDIQSAIINNKTTMFENIEYLKLQEVARLLRCKPQEAIMPQVGYSTQHNEEISDYYNLADFWHFDFFDKVLGEYTDHKNEIKRIRKIALMNSHFTIQIHIFSNNTNYISSIYNELYDLPVKHVRFFIHINNSIQPGIRFDFKLNIYPAIDVKDLLSDIPIDNLLVNKRLLLCLQSEKHQERATNAQIAISMLLSLQPNIKITLDRSITSQDLSRITQPIDSIVSGSYIRDYKFYGYRALKRSTNNA